MAAKTDVDASYIKVAFEHYQKRGAMIAKRSMLKGLKVEREIQLLDETADYFVARFHGKTWEKIVASLKPEISGSNLKIIAQLFSSYNDTGRSTLQLRLHTMKGFDWQVATFLLASFCGATSPNTIQDSRLFSSDNTIDRDTKRVLRVASTKTAKYEERGIFSGIFKAKTSTSTYLDSQTLSGIDELMATFKGWKGKSGDDLDEAIAAIAAKTNVAAADVEGVYKAYKTFGAARAKKALTSKMKWDAELKRIDNVEDSLVARFEGKSWDEVLETLNVSGAERNIIFNLFVDYHEIGRSAVRLALLTSKKINLRTLHDVLKT